MKTCSKCKKEKDETEFSKQARHKDGLDYRCKSCVREYRQTDAYKASQEAYRQSDTYKVSQKAYRQTDVRKEYLKAYQQTDAYREKNREYQKAYYLRKKAEAAALGKAAPSSGTQTMGAQE